MMYLSSCFTHMLHLVLFAAAWTVDTRTFITPAVRRAKQVKFELERIWKCERTPLNRRRHTNYNKRLVSKAKSQFYTNIIADNCNEATSDLSSTITEYVPRLIVVREEGNVDKTGFLRKKPLSSVCMYMYTYMYMHVCTHACTYIYIYIYKTRRPVICR